MNVPIPSSDLSATAQPRAGARTRALGAVTHPVVKFLLRRLALAIVTLVVVSVLVFVATQALPGDAAVAKLGRNATRASLAAFRAHFHLNKPIFTQYFLWVRDLLEGHLGTSLVTPESVSQYIGGRAVNSLVLLTLAALMGIPIALGLGIWSAAHRDGVFDHATSVALLALAAMPEFVLGILLTVLLATNTFHAFPAASLLNPQESVLSQLNFVLLPAITLALVIIPYIARMTRASLVEVLESDYIALARLKGISERRVILRHAFTNGAGPTFQAIALTLAYLAGGVVVVETVFQYPGLGLGLESAIQNRDLPVIQALVLLIAIVYIVVTLLADFVTILCTPRLRTQLR